MDLEAAFDGRLSQIVTVPPVSRTPIGTLAAITSRLPYIVKAHENQTVRAAVAQALDSDCYDVIHCDNISVVPAMPLGTQVPMVFNAHNVEAAIWERYLREERRPWMRLVLRSQLRKVLIYESRLPEMFDTCVVVSDQDRAQMSKYGFGRVHIVRNGVDLDYYQPLPDAMEPRLLFVGSLDWRPNQDGLLWFLESVWPLIRAARPGAQMTVVGRRPPQWIQSLCSRTGAALVADSPDVRVHLAEASVVVVPLRIGGGSRLKILEAMAAGRPVVSTTIGAEGLDLLPDGHILIADTRHDFAGLAVRLLQDPGARHALAQAGRALVEREYGWDEIAKELENAWAVAASSGASTRRIPLKEDRQ